MSKKGGWRSNAEMRSGGDDAAEDEGVSLGE